MCIVFHAEASVLFRAHRRFMIDVCFSLFPVIYSSWMLPGRNIYAPYNKFFENSDSRRSGCRTGHGKVILSLSKPLHFPPIIIFSRFGPVTDCGLSSIHYIFRRLTSFCFGHASGKYTVDI